MSRQGLESIIWRLTGSGASDRWCPVGPLGQGMGYRVHAQDKLSGGFVIRRAGKTLSERLKNGKWRKITSLQLHRRRVS